MSFQMLTNIFDRLQERTPTKLFDVLNERPFTRGEIKQFCTLLFGYEEDWPNDWILFLQALHTIQNMEKYHWNPISNQMEPWVDIQTLFAIGCYWE